MWLPCLSGSLVPVPESTLIGAVPGSGPASPLQVSTGEEFMSHAAARSPHTFHIPVMGTGFTIDAPLRVARYGISSVISLVDDVLIEQMREYHCTKAGEPFERIDSQEEDRPPGGSGGINGRPSAAGGTPRSRSESAAVLR